MFRRLPRLPQACSFSWTASTPRDIRGCCSTTAVSCSWVWESLLLRRPTEKPSQGCVGSQWLSIAQLVCGLVPLLLLILRRTHQSACTGDHSWIPAAVRLIESRPAFAVSVPAVLLYNSSHREPYPSSAFLSSWLSVIQTAHLGMFSLINVLSLFF